MTSSADVIRYGLAEVGDPYEYGAEGPGAFDCSGLMLYIFAKAGIHLPRTAAQQQKAVTSVATPQPGDLVFYGNPAHHVALYVGGGKMLAAPHTGANVRIQDVYGTPTYGRVAGVNSTASAALGVVQPIAASIDSQVAKLSGFGKIILFAAGGAALIVAGAWRLTKGNS